MKPSSCVGRGIVFGLLLFLSACLPIPDRINFLTDGRVLRGVYEATGTTESTDVPADARTLPLRLEVAPDYVDPNTYSLTGTVTVGDEAPVPFEGEASGGDTPTCLPSLLKGQLLRYVLTMKASRGGLTEAMMEKTVVVAECPGISHSDLGRMRSVDPIRLI